MGGKKSVTVGYRYYFGLHMGVARGPIDELVEIKVGDKTAWSGSVLDNQTIAINAPELFGGDKGEGGIQGTMEVLMGDSTQPVNAPLARMLEGLVTGAYLYLQGFISPPWLAPTGSVSAFRGVCTLFYDGLVTSLNPYPKPWKMRTRRAIKGWDGPAWYPEKAVVSLSADSVKAMNGAHIIYEVSTNRDWGRGLSATRLDAIAFAAAADTLHAEGFGLCLRWTRRDGVDNFIQQIIDHIGAAVFIHRVTGLLTLALIRDDYDPETLDLFTPDTGLLGIVQDNNAATSGGLNQQVVNWHDPITNEPGSVRVQNLASIQAGGTVSVSTDYVGLPTAELALRVAQRDLRIGSAGLKRFKVRLDRRAYKINPGGVFRISDPARGVENIILRAGAIDYGTLADGAITVTAVEDVFGLPASSFVGVQPSGWVPPSTAPAAITERKVIEAGYLDLAAVLSAADLTALEDDAGYVLAWGMAPTGLSLNYALQTRVAPVEFVEQGLGDFPSAGLLVAAMDKGAADVLISLSSTLDWDGVEAGEAALIDGELFRIKAVDYVLGMATLTRGCGDTVPEAHSTGAMVWFYDEVVGADATEYLVGTTVDVRLLTRTSAGELDPLLAATDSVLMDQRQFRPYPPGKLLINSVSYPVSISGQLVIDWAHRDRILQDDQIIDTNEASIGPEPGTTYTLRLYDENNILVRTESGLASTTYTWVNEEADSGLSGRLNTSVRIELESLRDGLTSTQKHDISFDRI